jgi:hypothetical protein
MVCFFLGRVCTQVPLCPCAHQTCWWHSTGRSGGEGGQGGGGGSTWVLQRGLLQSFTAVAAGTAQQQVSFASACCQAAACGSCPDGACTYTCMPPLHSFDDGDLSACHGCFLVGSTCLLLLVLMTSACANHLVMALAVVVICPPRAHMIWLHRAAAHTSRVWRARHGCTLVLL